MRKGGWAAKTCFAAVLAVATTASSSARADEDLEALLQQNVVSTASKTSEVANDAPATMSVLTADDIRRYGIRSLDEAIDFLGMGLVTQNPLHSVEVAGRGVQLTADYGNHVLLLVDGHVTNEGWNQTAYYEQGAGIPIELIDHIEVLLGPGSVLYGSNAMLAVINVITKQAAHYKGVRLIGEGSLSPAQGSGRITSFAPGDLGGAYRIGAGAGHELTLFGRKLEVTAHVERYHQDGPPFTFAPQSMVTEDGSPKPFGRRSTPGVWGGTVRNEYDTTVTSGYATVRVGDFTFMTRAASYERTTPTINYFNKSIGNFDDPRSNERDRWLSFDARYDKILTPKLSLTLHAAADSYDYLQRTYSDDGSDCAIPASGPCRFELPGVSRWLTLDGHLSYDWFSDDRLTTLAGAWVQGRYVGMKTDTLELSTNRQLGSVGTGDAYELPFAVFGQQRWTPARFVHLNGGARFDRAPRGGNAISPRAAVTFDTWRGGTAKLLYSQAFRAPTFYEVTFEQGDEIAARNLRREREENLEASVEQRFGRHTLFFGVFRSWWKDMVALRLIEDGRGMYENVGRLDNYGYNARADGIIGAFHYGLSVTGAHTHRSYGEGVTPITVAPTIFGNARVAYDLPGSLPTVALAAKFMGPRLADRALDGGFPVTPGVPTSVQLKLTFTGELAPVKGLSYRVGGDLSTARYSPYVAGPIQWADTRDPSSPRAALTPVNRLTVFAGLQYEL